MQVNNKRKIMEKFRNLPYYWTQTTITPTNSAISKWRHSRPNYMSWLKILLNTNKFHCTISEELSSQSITEGWTNRQRPLLCSAARRRTTTITQSNIQYMKIDIIKQHYYEKTVDTHKILINEIKFYACLQEIW